MDFEELVRHILLLSPEEKKLLNGFLSDSSIDNPEYLDIQRLWRTLEWKEIEMRSIEVVHEEKPCLIEFEEHLQSFQS